MSRFDTIDLSRLPVPDAISGLDYQAIMNERIADLLERFAAAEIPFEVEGLQTSPAIILQQEDAYRELLQFAAINDAVRAVLLASSWGSNLDAIGAMFGVARMVDPGNPNAEPPVPPTVESDDRYRRRIQLAPEAYGAAGTKGGYRYHALSADQRVLDVDVLNHADDEALDPGDVAVVILPATDDVQSEVVEAVRNRLMRDDNKPLTDALEFRVAEPIMSNITATLWLRRGPDPLVVKQSAETRLSAYLTKQRKIGTVVAYSGISGALHVEDVERVALASPSGDLQPSRDQVVKIGTITISTEFLE